MSEGCEGWKQVYERENKKKWREEEILPIMSEEIERKC